MFVSWLFQLWGGARNGVVQGLMSKVDEDAVLILHKPTFQLDGTQRQYSLCFDYNS